MNKTKNSNLKMKKVKLSVLGVIALATSTMVSAQVGINTETPKATIDVVALKTDGSTAEGLIAPRLTIAALNTAKAIYTADQTGAVVYVTDPAPTGQIANYTDEIKRPGYYYFDGTEWVSFIFTPATPTSNTYWQQAGNSWNSTGVLGTVDDFDMTFLRGNAWAGGLQRDLNTGETLTNYANTAFGTGALPNLLGNNNTAVGIDVMQNATTKATYNTAVGSRAMQDNTAAQGNTAMGYSALFHYNDKSANAGNNTAIGMNALMNSTSGSRNTGVGGQALAMTTGSDNTAIGFDAGSDIFGSTTTGLGNTVIGAHALGYNGQINQAGSKGNYNIILGYNAAANAILNGNSNILIASAPNTTSAQLPNSSLSNQLNIGNAIYGTNILQDDGTAKPLNSVAANIGINTAAPGAALEINSGTANASGLKFTQMNSSATPTTSAYLGVDASGNVVVATAPAAGGATVSISSVTYDAPTHTVTITMSDASTKTVTLPNSVTSVTAATGANAGKLAVAYADGTTQYVSVPGSVTYNAGSNTLTVVNADGTTSTFAEADGVIGNEVTDAADATLVRSGSGTAADPYKLKAGVMQTANIADNAVTSAKIADGSITGGDIAPKTINVTNLNGSTTAGQVPTTDASGNVTWASPAAPTFGNITMASGYTLSGGTWQAMKEVKGTATVTTLFAQPNVISITQGATITSNIATTFATLPAGYAPTNGSIVTTGVLHTGVYAPGDTGSEMMPVVVIINSNGTMQYLLQNGYNNLSSINITAGSQAFLTVSPASWTLTGGGTGVPTSISGPQSGGWG